eukprot:3549204-Amphidinium_carterae.1
MPLRPLCKPGVGLLRGLRAPRVVTSPGVFTYHHTYLIAQLLGSLVMNEVTKRVTETKRQKAQLKKSNLQSSCKTTKASHNYQKTCSIKKLRKQWQTAPTENKQQQFQW